MRVRVTRARAVDCQAILSLPLSARATWGQLRDFQRFSRQDKFHADIEISTGSPQAGAALKLAHRFLGFSVERVGRILLWREGIGFSFSDLSVRGPRHSFPHIFSYRIHPTGLTACDLEIRVRGLWTSRWTPRPLARLWLLWVFRQIVRHVQNEFLAYQLWRITHSEKADSRS